MTVRHPRQTGIPLSRYVVMILRITKKRRRSSAVSIGSTESEPRARQVLEHATAKGYTGWIEDRDTGHCWSPEAGWFHR